MLFITFESTLSPKSPQAQNLSEFESEGRTRKQFWKKFQSHRRRSIQVLLRCKVEVHTKQWFSWIEDLIGYSITGITKQQKNLTLSVSKRSTLCNQKTQWKKIHRQDSPYRKSPRSSERKKHFETHELIFSAISKVDTSQAVIKLALKTTPSSSVSLQPLPSKTQKSKPAWRGHFFQPVISKLSQVKEADTVFEKTTDDVSPVNEKLKTIRNDEIDLNRWPDNQSCVAALDPLVNHTYCFFKR